MASTGFDSKIKKAKFAFKDENFCLDGQLNKERDALLQDLLMAQRTAENKQAGGDQRINVNPVKIIQEKIDALEEQMRDSTITIRFTAVNNGLWQKWIIQNPPRKGNVLDSNLGYNTEKFFQTATRLTGKYVDDAGTKEKGYADAILEEMTESQWVEFDEALTAGDWDRIDTTLINLNQRDGQRSLDFLSAGSPITPDSETPSEPPVTSE